MKLRRFFSVLNRPLPGWLTLALFMLTAASASIYLYVGSVSVPAGGSFTTNSASTVTFGAPLSIANGGTGSASPAISVNAPLSISGSWPFQIVACATCTTGGPYVTSVGATGPLASSGGANPNLSLTGIVPVANGGTGAATQNFVDLSSTQTIGGVKTFTSGIVAPSGSFNGGVIGSSGDIGVARSATTGLISFGTTYASSYLEYGINNASAFTFVGGNVDIASGHAIVAGSSTYGPTSAVVNGPFTGTQFNGSGAGLTAGSVPNAALVTAPVTSVGASAPLSSSGGVNPIISCSTCGGTPVMGSGGTTVTGAHIVTGAWSCVTATLAAGDNACAATATFTGAAIYSTASSYSCSESIYSYTNTSATGLLIASGSVSLGVNYPFTTSGSSVTFGRVIQATIAGGTIGMNGSYYCVGV